MTHAGSTSSRSAPRVWVHALLSALGALACERAPLDSAPPAAAPETTVATRIVPASATALDLVAALVEPERIAGVPEQGVEYSTVAGSAAWFDALPRFSAYLAEPVLEVRPDLVVVEPWQAPETTARLREAGVLVYALPEIATYADARAALERLGVVLGSEDRARAAIAELDARVAALAAAVERRPRLRALAYSSFGGRGSTAGAGTTLDDVFRLAGLRNAAAEYGKHGHAALSFEELVALDPDLIVTSQPLGLGEGSTGDRGGAAERVLLGEPALARMRAVRERRIVALPARLYATGSHQIVSAAEELARAANALDAAPEEQ